MRLSLALPAIAAFCLVSCAPKPPDTAALRKTVDEYNAASKESMLSGKPDLILGYYEDDALEMAPNSPVIKGKAAIKEFQESMSKTGMKFLAVSFTTLELEADGKIAYEVGSYDMTINMPPMGDVNDKGKYVALWRQQPDGAWKVHAETWNTDTPMQPHEMPAEKKEDAKMKKSSK
jgi:ketosteroid isomerase-like protein